MKLEMQTKSAVSAENFIAELRQKHTSFSERREIGTLFVTHEWTM